uniref:Uncharacterized protein n=1 Tax=Anguilla anguilla TaxID=7936 RepID=A0A0E9UXJ5_ANGAN
MVSFRTANTKEVRPRTVQLFVTRRRCM